MSKMTPEGRVKAMIRKYLLDNDFKQVGVGEVVGDAFFWMPFQGAYSVRGVADFIICYRGLFVAIEAKADTDQTVHQKDFENLVASCGGLYFLVRTSYDMVELMEKLEWMRKNSNLPKP